VQILGQNSIGTNVLILTSSTAFTDTNWHHVHFSFDLSNTRGDMFIDGVSNLAGGATLTDDFIDVEPTHTWAFVATVSNTTRYSGDLGEFYLNIGQELQPDVVANNELFRSSAGMAERLDANGAAPTGSPPTFYLTGNDWTHNASGAGDFTLVGTAPSYPVQIQAEFDAEAPTAYCEVDPAEHFEYWRLWARGTNAAKFNFGEWYLSQAATLQRNPDQPGFATAIDIPQTVLATADVGERYNVRKDRFKRRGYSLSFQHGTTEQSDQWAEEFWERSIFGGLPVFFVPDNQKPVAIMAKPSEVGYEQSQVTSEVSTVDLELREVPHGVVGS
jgi:hypothetical protein